MTTTNAHNSQNPQPPDLLHTLLTVVVQCFGLGDLHDGCARPVEQASARADELLRAALDGRRLELRPLLDALTRTRAACERLGGVLHHAEQALTPLALDLASTAPTPARPLDPRLAEALVGLVDALALLRHGGPAFADTRPYRALRALVETAVRRALAGQRVDEVLDELRHEAGRLEASAPVPAQRVREALALLTN